MMPQHRGASSQPENVGYYIISDAIDGYTPGENYLGTVVTISVATLNARYHPVCSAPQLCLMLFAPMQWSSEETQNRF